MLATRDKCMPCNSVCDVCCCMNLARFHRSAENVLHQLNAYFCLSEDTTCVRLGHSFCFSDHWSGSGGCRRRFRSRLPLLSVLNRHHQPSFHRPEPSTIFQPFLSSSFWVLLHLCRSQQHLTVSTTNKLFKQIFFLFSFAVEVKQSMRLWPHCSQVSTQPRNVLFVRVWDLLSYVDFS